VYPPNSTSNPLFTISFLLALSRKCPQLCHHLEVDVSGSLWTSTDTGLAGKVHTNFDRYQIYGKAPWCYLDNSTDKGAACHYLSQEQCALMNAVSMDETNKPEDRGLCVPNPLTSSAGAGRIPTVTAAP
jgi:hypothetical protein